MSGTSDSTSSGLERLIFFTDAVTAIALTLLILPLVEAVPKTDVPDTSLVGFLAGTAGAIFSFLLSFAVIGRLWVGHHRIFQHAAAHNGKLVFWNLAWALSIVSLPFVTEIISAFDPVPLTVVLYIGVMALSSLFLTIMARIIRNDPGLENRQNPLSERTLHISVVITSLFFVALVIGALVPAINYWSLLLFFLTGPAEKIWARSRRSRTTM